jgi:hypothetical protein
MTDDFRPVPRDADGEEEPAAIELFRSRSGQMTCPPVELIQASMAGTLPPALESRIAAHLETCGICRTLGAALDEGDVGELTPEERDRILQRVHAGALDDQRAARRTRLRRWSTAAVLVLAAVGAVVMWSSRHSPTPTSAAKLPPRTGPAVQSVFDLDMPGLPSPESLGRRNGSPTPPAERAELVQALAPYRDKQYEEAAQKLREFVGRYPRNAFGHFYLGASDLFLDRDATAVTALESAVRLARSTDSLLARPASRYLALAYVRTGQVDRAQGRLKELCENPGEFALLACSGLQQVSVTYQLTGQVMNAAGEPVSGATVAEYTHRFNAEYTVSSPTRFRATSDATGQYTVSGVPLEPRNRLVLRASAPGYFSRTGGVSLSPKMSADFRLTPWTRISLDDVVKGTLRADDPGCRIPEPCREYAVSLPRSGTLDVSVVAPVGAALDLWVETPNGDVYSPWQGAPRRLSVAVFAGFVCQITVINYDSSPRDFELTMRLR